MADPTNTNNSNLVIQDVTDDKITLLVDGKNAGDRQKVGCAAGADGNQPLLDDLFEQLEAVLNPLKNKTTRAR
jgi:hypothetical protein